ncbi:MAG: Aldehyde dehydrogenase [Ktedonobacterales bacterium]|jgi:aldehyde dehydrogenase (NAD+)|nr:MAG: Aldehyde dehydrogenase [Ktedonobacterales bacterium]
MSGTPSVAEIFETMEYGPAPESSDPARAWLAAHAPRLRLFIGNEWREPSTGEYFASVNPATAQPLIEVAQAGAADVEAAVRAAREAFPAWSATPGHVRARYLYALARQIQKHSRLLAVLETMDNGKPIRETRDLDIPLVARHFYHYAGWAQLLDSEFPEMRPIGVCGQIIPWNFPLLMLAWKIAPALATGNTVVLKPAEFTSITAIAFAEIVKSVGLPPGVVNIVTGDGRTGELIVNAPDIDKIAFTGSTDVGRIIRKATAGSGKRLSLELGGKSPFVVFDDADLDSVVEGVVDAIWFNQGQVCCAGSRLLVQESVAEQLLAKLRARMEKLRVGDPLDKAVDIGAIIAPVQLEKIQRLVNQGVAEGAEMWQPGWACPTDGYFFPPTLFTGVSPAATIAQVEIFGPVLVAMTFRTPSEAVALANNTPYGLAASVWSENINLALDVSRKIAAGTVWINCTNVFDAASGFGGYRESGYGREGGREGLYEYLQPAWEAEHAADVIGEADHTLTASGKNGHKRGKKAHAEQVALAQANGAGDGAHLAPESDGFRDWPAIDRTPKLFIGGKQARPDSGYSREILGAQGEPLGEVGEGNRKDIRNAVEAAHTAATGWAGATAHSRAQILYYIAENLATRADEFAARIRAQTGRDGEDAACEVERAIERLFTYAAWADKYDGAVHGTPVRGLTLAVHEPVGVLGLACPDEYPLLGFVSLVAPAIAMGNTVIALPSERHPLSATDFYAVLETSDVPAGVVNIVTGARDTLAKVLAEHDDVDGVWYFGSAEGARLVEAASTGNMKRTWVSYGHPRAWLERGQGEGQEFLREATQVKNIWTPMGE